MLFAWDEWNISHIARHRVTQGEAEYVVAHGQEPWPQQKGDDKLVVWGPDQAGRLLQVIFAIKRPDEIEFESLTIDQWADLNENDRVVYVVHAMELTAAMKRQYRRRKKRQ